jgi:hypothetical protein
MRPALAPDKSVVRIPIPVMEAEAEKLSEGAKRGAGKGQMPNRSAWLVDAALKGGLTEKDIAAAKGHSGHARLLQVTVAPEKKPKIEAMADKLGLATAAYMRACGLAEARRLGVK